jgi:hypothetical protein
MQLNAYYLPYIKLPKTPDHYVFTLKTATAMFAETLGNFQCGSASKAEVV